MSSTLVKPRPQSPTTIWSSLIPSQQIPRSITELLHSSEMHLERRSLPCLRVPAAQSSQPKSPRIDTSPIERPCSPSSTSSSRRSVSGMKQLLPFKLQLDPPLPKVDLAAWLDDAVPSMDSHNASPLESEPIQGSSHSQHFSSMRPSQDVRLSGKLPPSRYRETPVYSEPGSPQLGLAYFSDSDSCSRCPPPKLLCDELCIVSDYEDAESAEANSEASFVEYEEVSPSAFVGYEPVDTSPTSFVSSRSSALSIKCRGEHLGSDVTKRTMDYPSWCDEMDVVGSVEDTNNSGTVLHHGRMDAWIGSDSSRCSSPSSGDEVFNVRSFYFP